MACHSMQYGVVENLFRILLSKRLRVFRIMAERPRQAHQARWGHVFAGVVLVLEHPHEGLQDLTVSLYHQGEAIQ